MNKEKSQNNLSRKKIDRILFVGVLLVLFSGPLISYVKGHNMEFLVDILNLVRFFYLLAFFVYLVDRAFNKQEVRQISEKDTEIIENIVNTCLKDTFQGEPMGTHELVYCVQHYLEKKGIFYITYYQINNCIERMFFNGEHKSKDIRQKLHIDPKKRRIWRILAYYAIACYPGGFALWVLGGLGILHMEHYVEMGYFMLYSGFISGYISIELRTRAKSQF